MIRRYKTALLISHPQFYPEDSRGIRSQSMDIRNELTLVDSPCQVDDKVVYQDAISGSFVRNFGGGID
jgi:hypothetical protein